MADAARGQLDGMDTGSTIIKGWPDEAREAAQLVIDTYGEPHEATESQLLWHGVRPWKRIVATRTSSPVSAEEPVRPGSGRTKRRSVERGRGGQSLLAGLQQAPHHAAAEAEADGSDLGGRARRSRRGRTCRRRRRSAA